jgi:hypothetical protein
VDGDWYTYQLNSGKIVLYGKASGVYTTQGSVTGNRFFSFTSDPNASVASYNTNDYGVYYTGGMANFVQYTGTWTTLFSWPLTTPTGPSWGFFATKTIDQPLTGTSGVYSTINFEDSSTGVNFNNGSWSLNQYVFAANQTQKKFVVDNLKISHSTVISVTYTCSIVLNNNTGSPLATATLVVGATSNNTLPLLETTLADYTAGDVVKLVVKPGSTATTPIANLGSTFYISA